MMLRASARHHPVVSRPLPLGEQAPPCQTQAGPAVPAKRPQATVNRGAGLPLQVLPLSPAIQLCVTRHAVAAASAALAGLQARGQSHLTTSLMMARVSCCSAASAAPAAGGPAWGQALAHAQPRLMTVRSQQLGLAAPAEAHGGRPQLHPLICRPAGWAVPPTQPRAGSTARGFLLQPPLPATRLQAHAALVLSHTFLRIPLSHLARAAAQRTTAMAVLAALRLPLRALPVLPSLLMASRPTKTSSSQLPMMRKPSPVE